MEFPTILLNEKVSDRNMDFRNAFFSMTEEMINEDNSHAIIGIYTRTKLPELKYTSLKLLCNKTYPFLKDFFLTAYKKERYLDMRLLALRGLSQFISEKELEKLMTKFNEILAKRPLTTPYNYQEYEMLKGKYLLPYLIDRYNYQCFKDTLNLVEKQYEAMPSAFRGHFTTNEKGEVVRLKEPGESARILNNFFEAERRKTGMNSY